ncbi:MAG: PAS domain-containing protein [Acidobacteria bacterium]|nr:PAS domain-containing protein [Acidobacteriota bacterium]
MSSSRMRAFEPLHSMLRGFVVLRVVVVSTILLSAFLIQFTFSTALPLNDIYYLAAFAYSISIAAVLSLDRIPPEANAAIQLLGDLVVITGLVYISGGADSSFSFLYLGTVAAGAILLGRQGGLVSAGLASVFYAVLVDLMYFGALKPVPSAERTPHLWTAAGLVGQVALHAGAFVVTALLVSYSSNKLRETRTDLERRKSEIARLQALHGSVLGSMSSGVLTTDPDGLVTFANRAAQELLGVPSVDLVGRPVQSLGLIGEAAWRRIAAAGSEILRFETTRRIKDQDAYFGVSSSALRDGSGYTVGRILIFQNVTHVKRLEGEVRLKDKLAAVGELAAGIAHEIRNPLASISGSVQALQGSVPSGSPEHRLMKIVVAESHRLSSILEDFLRYVRPKERAVEPVDAPAALRDVLTLLAHSDEVSSRHAIDVRTAPDSFVLSADPGQLRQIFWNVARNALAAMPGGGTLTVTATLEGAVWKVSFADEGHGMTEDERGRLFTPFAHSFPGGTGLGLAIVHRIVEEHGGTIEVDSTPGRGATVAISLPRNDASTGARPTETALAAAEVP